MKTVLLTGFEPFGGESVNPSALAVQQLDGRTIAKHRVVTAVLPCAFGDSLAALRRELRRTQPKLVVCVGQAGGRQAITIERVAINVDDARIPDNVGAQPIDAPIVRSGPAAYFSTLPIKAMVAALTEAGIAGAVSQTAGTFVCNHVFYGLMRSLQRREGVRGGFVHVPFLPAQAEANQRGGEVPPSMPLAQIVEGLEVAVRAALTTRKDPRIVGGATH